MRALEHAMRVEAAMLAEEADAFEAAGGDEAKRYEMILRSFANAKFKAADQMRSEREVLQAKLQPQPGDVAFNPKGRP